jgi:ribosome biogenesis protein
MCVQISQYSLVDSSYRILYQCKGHKGSVEAVAVDQSKKMFATASADSTVKVWAVKDPSEEESVEFLDTKNKKRRKTDSTVSHKVKVRLVKCMTQHHNGSSDRNLHLQTFCQTLNGHVGPVTSVIFDNKDSNIVYTGGWDHSIRSWDVEQQVNVTTKVSAFNSIYSKGLLVLTLPICRTVKKLFWMLHNLTSLKWLQLAMEIK